MGDESICALLISGASTMETMKMLNLTMIDLVEYSINSTWLIEPH